MSTKNIFMSSAAHHFDNMAEIPCTDVILSEEVRKLCEQNKCGQYDKNWTCPPAIKSVDAFRKDIAAFDTFLIVYQVYNLNSSLDWRGMMSGGADFKDRLLALKKELEEKTPAPDFMILGAGGCHLCDPCAYVEGEPCRNPDDAIIAVEACGIDVMGLMKDHGLKYYNGKNTVTFIGGVLYNQGYK